MNPEDLASTLADFLKEHHGAREVRIENLRLLTGGASRQMWSFDARVERGRGRVDAFPLVLRSASRSGVGSMDCEVEYRLLEAAVKAGTPAPHVHALGDDSLGMPFFLMERVDGETIARRLLRDEQYAQAREAMTAQLARALTSIHEIPVDTPGIGSLPGPLEGMSPAESELSKFETTYRGITPDPHPAFELAFRWLKRNLPPSPDEVRLVHGDFRIGNVIFGPEGLRAVLDWELAHRGDPMEDLAWVCVRAWRFGNDEMPVGGIGRREDLWQAYEEASGRKVDRGAARWWEVFGNLRWGVMTIMQARGFLDESTRSRISAGAALELATIGRRTAETEWELLELISEPGA